MPRRPSSVRPWLILLVGSAGACFASAEPSRGLPCTEDASCGDLQCSYGVCGGPTRCEAGAGVGEYCFTFDDHELVVGAGIDALGVGTIDPGPLPDLVVGNGGARTLTLLRNDGGGVLAVVGTSTPLDLAARELGVGPIDGAGWSDVIATTAEGSVVLVPVGADGSFLSPLVLARELTAAARPQIGQFVDDASGLADVAVLVDDGFDVIPQQSPSVFGAPVHTELQAAADLRTFGADASRVYVASRTGNSVVGHSRTATGAFAATTTIDVGPGPSRFVLADLDGDQFGDVLTAGASGTMWLTTGRDPSFVDPRAPLQVYDLGWEPSTLAAVDLDDDPEPEFVVSGRAPGGRRDVYLFDNDGEGRPLYGGSLGIDDASAVVIADLDLDGIPEIVVASQDDGTVRIARRAVAPLPPGEESSAGSSGMPGTSGVDPSNADDPTVPEPTVPDDATTPIDDDSGDDPCGGTGISIGPFCYAGIQDPLPLGATGIAMATGRLDPDAPESLVVLGKDGSVWEHGGDLSGVFAPADGPSHFASADPNGLAVGTMPLGAGFDEAVIAVSHGGGVSVFSPQHELTFGEILVEGGSVAPLVDAMLFDADTGTFASALAFVSSQGLHLATAAALQDGAAVLDAPGTLGDVDAIGLENEVVLAATSPAGILAYLPSATALNGVGPLLDAPGQYAAVLRGPGYTQVVLATASDLSRVVFGEDGASDLFPIDAAIVLADLQTGELDGAQGDDLVVMVDEGGVPWLRIYGSLEDGSLVLLSAFPIEHATSFAVYDFWMPSDLLIAYEDPMSGSTLLHLGTLVSG